MLNPEEEQFEARLKEFRPLAVDPLPVEQAVPARQRKFVLAVCAAAAVVVVVVAAVIARQRANQFAAIQRKVKVVDVRVKVVDVVEAHALTIRSANELLAGAPSVKSALDDLAFQRRSRQLPGGTQSALAVLGEEDFKP